MRPWGGGVTLAVGLEENAITRPDTLEAGPLVLQNSCTLPWLSVLALILERMTVCVTHNLTLWTWQSNLPLKCGDREHSRAEACGTAQLLPQRV